MAESTGPSPDDLLEQIRRLQVSDVIVSTMSTLAQLGYAKLDPEARDLAQAALAIEALRGLLPVLETAVPKELARDLGQVTANLQLAYAGAVAEGPI